MKILIFQRRFHPNSIGIVKGLRLRGHDVRMLVYRTEGICEDSSDVEVLHIPNGRVGSALLRLAPGRISRNHHAPSLPALWREMWAFHADIVIVKKEPVFALIASMMAGAMRSKRILLTNDSPRTHEKWWRTVFVNILVRFFMRPERPSELGFGHAPSAG